jgi:hypothetical protein
MVGLGISAGRVAAARRRRAGKRMGPIVYGGLG